MDIYVLKKYSFEQTYYYSNSQYVYAYSSVKPSFCNGGQKTGVDGIMLALALKCKYPNCVTAVVKEFDAKRERKAADILYNITRGIVISSRENVVTSQNIEEMDGDMVLYILHDRNMFFGNDPKITYTPDMVTIEKHSILKETEIRI